MSKNHNVFLSWSGELSRLVAEFLRGWLAAVVQAAKPWMSESEIDKGSRSLPEISKALADIKVGIVCLTPENLHRPWLLFESGALSKSIDERTRLCTYLIGEIEPSDVGPPLGMFQGTRATKQDTLRLVQTINQVVSEDPVTDESLTQVFDAMWPKLAEHLESLPPHENNISAKRPPDELLGEILELARAQAGYRKKTEFIDAYIPTFQQFLPLLHQLISNVNRNPLANARLAYPRDTSLERTQGESGFLNTLGLSNRSQGSVLADSGILGGRLDLVQMFGGSTARAEGAYGTLRITLRGGNPSGAEETYELDLMLEVAAARKLARYLEEIADNTERHQIRYMSNNIQQLQNVREALADTDKSTPPDQ